jgi:hypothetical protein
MICPCCKEFPCLTETQEAVAGLFGFFGQVLAADGPGRRLVALSAHHAALPMLCTTCAEQTFQPAWRPLSPAVERGEAAVAAAKTRLRTP